MCKILGHKTVNYDIVVLYFSFLNDDVIIKSDC